MTYAELEELEKGARMAEGTAVDIPDVPISRKVFNGLTGATILLVGGLIVLVVVLWRAH